MKTNKLFPIPNLLAAVLTGLAVLLLPAAAQAQGLTWDPAGGGASDGAGTWDSGLLWWNGSADVTWTSGSGAMFGNGGTGNAVTLGAATTVNSLTMNAFSGTYTLGSSGSTITLNNGITNTVSAGATTIISPITLGAAQTWQNDSGNPLTIGTDPVNNNGDLLTFSGGGNITVSSAISGGGGLLMIGSGIVTLSGTNNYAGATIVSAGTLAAAYLANAGAPSSIGAYTGTDSGGLILTNGSIFSYTGSAGGSTTRGFRISGAANGTADFNIVNAVNLTMGNYEPTVTGNLSVGGSGNLLEITRDTVDSGINSQIIANIPVTVDEVRFTVSSSSVSPNFSPVTAPYQVTIGNVTNTVANGNVVVGGSQGGTITNSVNIGTGTFYKAGGALWTFTGSTFKCGTLACNGSAGGFTFSSPNPINNGNFSGKISFNNTGTFTYNSPADQAFGSAISGPGQLVQQGPGTLTLYGACTYTGPTTVNGGKLVGVVGGACKNSAVTVSANGGCTLGIYVTDNTKQWTCASLTFADASGGLQFGFNTTPSASLAPLSVTNLTFTGTPTLYVDPANLVSGNSYPLLVYSGTLTGTAPTSATIGGGLSGTLAWGTGSPYSANTLVLTVSGTSTQPLTWNSSGTGPWDINLTQDWKDNTGAAAYYQQGFLGYAVQFTDANLSADTVVSLNTNVVPASVMVSNSIYNYTISGSGSIQGTTGITKNGSKQLTLAGTNGYTGTTTINGGTLLVNGSLGAALAVSSPVTINGGTLGGTGTIGGTVTVNSGTVNGSCTILGDVTVNGGTLGGTGIINAAVTNNAGGTISPTGFGTLTINSNLVLTTGSTNTFAVNGSTPANTSVALGGAVTYGGVLNIVPSGTFSAGQNFTLFSGAGATNASNFDGIAGSPGAGLAFSFTNGVLSVVSVGPALGTNAYLAALAIMPAGTLSPAFTTNGFSYNATNAYVNNPVTVTASSVDTNATLTLTFDGNPAGPLTNGVASGNLTLLLNPPVNPVVVTVVSQDLSVTNIYTVNVVLQPSLTVPELTNSVVGGTNLVLSWPADHLGYRLLMQTNNLSKGVSSVASDWGTVAGSQSVTTMNLLINKAGGTNEFYRLVYP